MLVPLSNYFDVYGQSEFDSDEMGLQMPMIIMNPTSGQPGTEIEIKVTNLASTPENIDPRIEFFVYLPFLSAIGSNVPNNCAGQSCFALYSFDEVGENKFAPKTITFTLFSTTNPKPIVEEGWMNSVCDLKINGKTIERYGNTCMDKDQPPGDYEIKFGWGIQRSDLYDVRKTLTFTVTEKIMILEEKLQDEEEFVIEQFLEGLISELEFEERLAELGYDPQETRKVKALIGKLEHQEGYQTPLRGPIKIQGTDFEITYAIAGGVINQIIPDTEAQSLMVQIDSISNGTLVIKLPREAIDAKFGEEDDDFFVLIDGWESDFDETRTGVERTLTIEYPEGTEEIEIIGTYVIPEFGGIAVLILMVSLFSVIFVSRNKLGFYSKI
ncbi:MAG: PEFG-CTERM sorting domain-containing protein [Thaumarchaeota archaeon]|nr:PEFG-CTERM sorting domain-containing protein [Nitrososphaerota archaeon]